MYLTKKHYCFFLVRVRSERQVREVRESLFSESWACRLSRLSSVVILIFAQNPLIRTVKEHRHNSLTSFWSFSFSKHASLCYSANGPCVGLRYLECEPWRLHAISSVESDSFGPQKDSRNLYRCWILRAVPGIQDEAKHDQLWAGLLWEVCLQPC